MPAAPALCGAHGRRIARACVIGYRRWPMNMTLPPDATAAAVADPDPARRTLLAERLRALAHPVRLTMLGTLAAADRCVCGELVRALPLAQSTVSQHLRVLQDAGLVRSRPEGPRTAYCLDRETLSTLREELDGLFAQLLGTGPDCHEPGQTGGEG